MDGDQAVGSTAGGQHKRSASRQIKILLSEGPSVDAITIGCARLKSKLRIKTLRYLMGIDFIHMTNENIDDLFVKQCACD